VKTVFSDSQGLRLRTDSSRTSHHQHNGEIIQLRFETAVAQHHKTQQKPLKYKSILFFVKLKLRQWLNRVHQSQYKQLMLYVYESGSIKKCLTAQIVTETTSSFRKS